MKCKFCECQCIKKGFQQNGEQKYQCKKCKKYQQENYVYQAYRSGIYGDFRMMIKRGLGVIDMRYLLRISKTTVLKWIKEKSKAVLSPSKIRSQQEYESDEFHTVIRGRVKQEVYVSYVINRVTKQVINFCVGSRDQVKLGIMLAPVLSSNPRKIYTDGWSSYGCIIPNAIHRVRKYLINTIERSHLTVRTQVKRVSRNFMHQSRSVEMLVAYLKIYFWG